MSTSTANQEPDLSSLQSSLKALQDNHAWKFLTGLRKTTLDKIEEKILD